MEQGFINQCWLKYNAFDDAYAVFNQLEVEAMALNEMPMFNPNKVVADFIDTVGIPKWKQGIEIMEGLKPADLTQLA